MKEAGRELDALVAEKVMGLKVWQQGRSRFYETNTSVYNAVPPYSTSTEAAWQVVEKINLFSEYVLYRLNSGSWVVCEPGPIIEFARGETAPHAICLAALAAVGADV